MLLPSKRQNARAGLRQAAAAADEPPKVELSVWLKTRLPLSRHAALLPIDAPLPPLPTCSVPAEIVVLPL